jgi:hypothetical protein
VDEGTVMTRAFVAAILLLVGAASVQAQGRANSAAVGPTASISIQNVAGSVKVSGWSHDSVAVRGTAADPDRLAIHRGESSIRVGTWDAAAESVPPVDMEVFVPARATVSIRTGSASIFASRFSGSLEVTSIRGDIEIRGTPRDVSAESMTGLIVLDVRTALARARSVTSAIRLHGEYDDVAATSVSGNILIDNATVRRGSFESVDGELRFVGSFRQDAELAFITHSGAVDFLLPGTTSATIRSVTFAGSLHSEFSEPVRTSVSKVKGSEHVLTLRGGSAQVNVRSFRGRIVIRQR